MRRGRASADQEGVRRVLLLCGALLAVAGIGVLLMGGWWLVIGPALVACSVACVVVARDDGRGTWCPECVARNPADALTCERCGSAVV